MSAKRIAIIAVGIIAAFGAGILAAPALHPEIRAIGRQAQGAAAVEGAAQANVSIEGNAVILASGCRALTFDVTDDQAFAISNGIERTFSARPLTHDILKDVMETFGIRIVEIEIDRFEDDIYKARAVLKQGGRLLELDLRPSDAIALATRSGTTVYVSNDVMDSRSVKIC